MENNVAIARAQYIAWLRREFPSLYEDSIASIRDSFEQKQMSGFLDTISGAFTSLVDNVSKNLPQLAQTYVQYDAQKDLIKANTARAQQGLPPLQYNQQGQLVTATGLPYTMADYQLAQSGYGLDSTTMLLIVGGLALVLIILFAGRSSPRRR